MKTLPWKNHWHAPTAARLFAVLTLAAVSASGQYPDPAQKKLLSRAQSGFAFNAFGDAVAISDRFVLVGEYANDDKGDNAGAAYLFDARSGRYLRKLTAGSRARNFASFGGSVALSGALTVIGAAGHDGGRGAAYLLQAGSGRLRRELTAPDGAPNDFFGGAVALNADLVLVGASSKDSARGAAYLFDARSGTFLRMLAPSDPANGDTFGRAVALCGPLALIAAPGKDSQRGAAYLFDARSGQQLFKLTASDAAAGDYFGDSLAISGGRVLIGAPSKASGTGAVYVFETSSGAELRKIVSGVTDGYFGYSVALEGELALIGADSEETGRGAAYLYHAGRGDFLARIVAPDRAEFENFGSSMALSSERAVVGKNGDAERGHGAGAAYLCQPLAAPLTMQPVAVRGGNVSGGSGEQWAAFSQVRIKPNDRAALLASLSGAGTGGGRHRAVWHEISGVEGALALRSNHTDVGGGLRASRVLDLRTNHHGVVLMHAELRGSGVNAGNRQALLRHDVTGPQVIARGGTEFSGVFAGVVPRSFTQVVQSGPSEDQIAASVRLQRGLHGVTSANDRAICVFNHHGALLGQPYRANGPVNGGGTLGQPADRVAQSYGMAFCAFSGAWFPADGSSARRANFYSDGFSAPVRVATQGAVATGTDGARYRSMLAEGINTNGYTLWRASLARGDGVTSRNDEGLWFSNASGFHLIARKGQEIDPIGRPGVKIARLLRFWPTRGPFQAVMLVRLSGPGINSSCDLALCLWDALAPGSLHVLLQEGEAVEGTDGRRVRVIQRVDVDPVDGRYVVLCSLTGAAAGNQALFWGSTAWGNATTLKVLRQPLLRLHKGRLHLSETGAPVRLRGITLTPALDKTGAGGKGLGQVINLNGSVSVILTFDGKVQEVRTGAP